MVASLTIASLILLWPADNPPTVGQPSEELYTGKEHQLLEAGELRSVAIVLDDGSIVRPTASTTTAVPQLLGLADGSAYLKSASSGEVKYLREGQDLDGWTLRYIGTRIVRLEQGPRMETLRLFSPVSTRAISTTSSAVPGPTVSPAVPDVRVPILERQAPSDDQSALRPENN
jgi:hypothetical protein